ncbi:MAG: hypothetical protein ABWK02_07740 [Aquificaceae bacterium]
MAGYTVSNDFPTTTGAYDTTYNGVDDAFIAKFDSLSATSSGSGSSGGGGCSTVAGVNPVNSFMWLLLPVLVAFRRFLRR